jgi:ATP-binding cassette subfamily C protein
MKNRIYNAGYEFKEAQSLFFGSLSEHTKHHKLIKLFSLSKTMLIKLDEAFVRLWGKVLSYQRKSYIFSSLDRIIVIVSQILIFCLGGVFVITNQITIGDITILSSYTGLLVASCSYFFSVGKQMQDTRVSYSRLEDILNISSDSDSNNDFTGAIETVKIKNLSIEYDNRIICYPTELDFNKGKIYGIVGSNGIGKTSLINAIVGLIPNMFSGEILFNNIPIDSMPLDKLRGTKIVVCEQECSLFSDSIYFNLTLGINQNHDHIQEIINTVSLDTYLALLPYKERTKIYDMGANISGGENQKISLARALLKTSELLLLDEPTSSMDSCSKKKLFEYLNRIKNDKIIIVVSHDKEIAPFFDAIYHV